ncbi:MAG: heme ABC transporter ATP-binding protein [Chloroflexi bacterium]|nr:heme ABC transporter ATP-binding protein [Chloroflexota bacterium]
MTILSISNLSVSYHGRAVLRGVSLNVKAGEVLALIGPNGVGKSTFIRAVSGVVRPDAGKITLDSTDLLRLSPDQRARQIAVVPQAVSLPDAFTVAEIVMMGRTPYLPLWGGESKHDCRVAWDAMRRTEIEMLADRRADELSGGERQRVVIARALAQEPRVLLLDEPTAHLDLKHQVAVLELARALAREGGLAVLATLHDLNQAAGYADQVALLHNGEVRAVGRPVEVFTPAHLSLAYGLPINVISHPMYSTPLVLPDGKTSNVKREM